MTTENLRREIRVDVRVPIVIFRGRSPVALETSDVSFKGLFVCTTEPPPLRALVRLKVALYDREFDAHAMAVHVVTGGDGAERRTPGVGLQFWGLAGPDRIAWDEFVRGLVHRRRPAAKRASASFRAVLAQPMTPSSVKLVGAKAVSPLLTPLRSGRS